MEHFEGQTIDHYLIIEQIGRGGMATVYKARDQKLKRFVAIKLIRQEAFGTDVFDRLRKRFEREAQALAKLDHPNIVKVFDYGDYNGLPYLIMDYLPGTTLKEIPKPLSPHKAIQLLLPIAEALSHAHSRGILHRDVKPSNILITESGTPMLADFGIAKILELNKEGTLTETGVGIGTPEYMAPEQGLGKAADQRTDIYSLGVVLFELITGEKPFTADTPLAVLYKQMNDPLPDITSFPENNNKSITYILSKCLAKTPDKRFSSMKELISELERFLQNEHYADDFYLYPVSNEIQQIDKDQKQSFLSKKIIISSVIALFVLFSLIFLYSPTFKPGQQITQSIEITTTDQISAVAVSKATATPTSTAEPSPTPLPTQISLSSLEPITVDNISDLQLIKSLGRGSVKKMYLDESQDLLFIWGNKLYVFIASTFEEIDPEESGLPDKIIQISPNGKYCITYQEDKYQLWDFETYEKIRDFNLTDAPIYEWVFSQNDNFLSVSTENNILLWELPSGQLTSFANSVEADDILLGTFDYFITNDGIVLKAIKPFVSNKVVGSKLNITDVNNEKMLCTLNSYSIEEQISPNGKFFFTREYAQIRMWDLQTCYQISKSDLQFKRTDYQPTAWIYTSLDGKHMISSTYDNSINSYSISDTLHLDNSYELPFTYQIAAGVAYESLSRVIIAANNGMIYKLDVDNNEIIDEKQLFDPVISGFDLANDNSKIITYSKLTDTDTMIQLWDIDNEEKLFSIITDTSISTINFSPNNELFATGGIDNIVRLWITDGLQQIIELEGHPDSISTVKFSPDGDFLYSGDGNGTIIKWDVSTGNIVYKVVTYSETYTATYNGYTIHVNHTGSVWNFTFSPDGSKYCACQSRYSHIMETETGTILTKISDSGSSIKCKFIDDENIIILNVDQDWYHPENGFKNQIITYNANSSMAINKAIFTSHDLFSRSNSFSANSDIFASYNNLYNLKSDSVITPEITIDQNKINGKQSYLLSDDGRILLLWGDVISLYGITK